MDGRSEPGRKTLTEEQLVARPSRREAALLAVGALSGLAAALLPRGALAQGTRPMPGASGARNPKCSECDVGPQNDAVRQRACASRSDRDAGAHADPARYGP